MHRGQHQLTKRPEKRESTNLRQNDSHASTMEWPAQEEMQTKAPSSIFSSSEGESVQCPSSDKTGYLLRVV